MAIDTADTVTKLHRSDKLERVLLPDFSGNDRWLPAGLSRNETTGSGPKPPEAGQPGLSGNIQDLTQHCQFSVAPEI